MSKKVKAIHALNWFYGNYCTRKCSAEISLDHYQKMKRGIEGQEDYPITHKLFMEAMRKKHKICDLTEAEFRKSTKDFWKMPCIYNFTHHDRSH